MLFALLVFGGGFVLPNRLFALSGFGRKVLPARKGRDVGEDATPPQRLDIALSAALAARPRDLIPGHIYGGWPVKRPPAVSTELPAPAMGWRGLGKL